MQRSKLNDIRLTSPLLSRRWRPGAAAKRRPALNGTKPPTCTGTYRTAAAPRPSWTAHGAWAWPARSPIATFVTRDASKPVENKAVATPIHSRSERPEGQRECANCGHGESEHGTTGTRPCLATVGTLFDPDFCPCDEFRPMVAKAA